MELADQTHLWNNSINSARPLFPCSLCHCAKTQGIARICCIPSSEQLHPSSSHGFCGSGYAACEQEGAQMKGFLSGFILMGDTIAIFYSASQPLALLQPTRILVLQNPSVPVPYNSSWSLKSSGKAKERFIFKFKKDFFGSVWFGFQRGILPSSHISGSWRQEKSSFSEDSVKMLKYHEAQWTSSIISGMSLCPGRWKTNRHVGLHEWI